MSRLRQTIDAVFGYTEREDRMTELQAKLEEEKAVNAKLHELAGTYEKVFDLLREGNALLYKRCGAIEQEIAELRLMVQGRNYLIVQSGTSPVLDNLHNRLSLLESQVLSTSILNKQHLMRLLGLNEDQIVKRLQAGNGTKMEKSEEGIK